MDDHYRLYVDSPIGWLEISGGEKYVQSIHFVEKAMFDQPKSPETLLECKTQLEEYFKGTRKSFDFPYEMMGTDFQKKVWKKLLKIPFGQTKSYGDIAREMGSIKSVRAVGLANGKNNLSIVIPCHRVIGTNNQLTGYGGGLVRKDWLLKHEKIYSGIEHQLDIFHITNKK